MLERRRYSRWEGRLLVDLEDSSGLIFEAVGLNISLGGMCLIFPDAPAPTVGQTYGVTFVLPTLPTLPTEIVNEIEVRWIDRVRSKLCGGVFVHGLRAREVYVIQELLKLDQT